MKPILQLLFLLSFGLVYAQVPAGVDYLTANASLRVYPQEQVIEGTVSYTLQGYSPGEHLLIDARRMDIREVRFNGKKVTYSYESDTLVVMPGRSRKNIQELSISFRAKPEKAVYFIRGEQDSTVSQVWTQGQGKYSSNWIPSFDAMEEKVEFDLSISVPEKYQVIANGELVRIKQKEGLRTWVYDMDKPMSSYLLAFAMGDYEVEERISSGGTPIKLFFQPEDSLKVEPTYRYTTDIFNFLEEEIGIPYPWGVYKQVPVQDFMYAGMENTTLTIFSDRYVIDSLGFNDQNYVNVNAHELAHHWFGNLVTEESAADHWLHEGFATYYAYLAEREIFGDEYFYWKLFDNARVLKRLSDNDGGESLLDPSASSSTFYEKGAWALFALRNQIGTEAFRDGIRKYLQKFEYQNVTVASFLNIMEEVSGQSLSQFRETWLEDEEFPYRKALQQLQSKSKGISCYLEMRNKLIADPGPSAPILRTYWDRCDSPFSRAQMVREHFRSMEQELQLEALQSPDHRVQRMAAEMLERPEPEHFETYLTLLNADSYKVQEVMLAKLWIHFPGQRARILEILRGREGLPDKNLRMLWLTLAVLTPGFDEDKKENYLQELASYTAPGFGQETRQAAFQFLYEIREIDEKELENLVEATGHHAWQFSKFANSMIDSLIKNDRYRTMLTEMLPRLEGPTKLFFMQKLNAQ